MQARNHSSILTAQSIEVSAAKHYFGEGLSVRLGSADPPIFLTD
jgi:hypothetical protein